MTGSNADYLKCRAFSSLVDLSALDLDIYLRQRSWSGASHYPGSVGRVVDRAVAGTGELTVLVDDGTSHMRADPGVSHEAAAVQVNQHRRLPGFAEIDRRSGSDLGDRSDGFAL